MALSEQQAPLRNLVIFKRIATEMGCRLTEGAPEDPKIGSHTPHSWHYDTGMYKGVKHGLAIDVNYGAPGTSPEEQRILALLAVIGQSLGLGIIFALNGTMGSAADHKTHLHADVGSVSNTGRGARPATPGDACVWDTQWKIRAAHDNLAGDETKRRLYALREASKYGGVDFPFGVKYTQDVVGTKKDGDWGPNSRGSHDDTISQVQEVWRSYGLYTGKIDNVWGPLMEEAWRRFLNRYGR